MANVDNILSLVNVAGSKERYDRYRSAVENTLPANEDKKRYWSIYAQVAQGWVEDDRVKDKGSILTCMFNAAKFGLNPDPALGQIYFIPYNGVLTYQLGYKGMIKLSRNTGNIRDIRSGLICEKDKWLFYEDETGQHYRFEPNYAEQERGKLLFAYSIFEDKEGTPTAQILEAKRLDGIEKMVLARTPKSPWANELFKTEMQKKSAIRNHWKTQPMSPEMADAIDHEESIERGELKTKIHEELEGIIDQIVKRTQPPAMMLPTDTTTSEAPVKGKGKNRPAEPPVAAPVPTPVAAPAPAPAPTKTLPPEPEPESQQQLTVPAGLDTNLFD